MHGWDKDLDSQFDEVASCSRKSIDSQSYHSRKRLRWNLWANNDKANMTATSWQERDEGEHRRRFKVSTTDLIPQLHFQTLEKTSSDSPYFDKIAVIYIAIFKEKGVRSVGSFIQ